MSDIFIKNAGQGSAGWRKASNLFIKNAGQGSSGWRPAVGVWIKNATQWLRVWPQSGIFATRVPYIGYLSSDTYAGRMPNATYGTIRIGDSYFGDNAVWDLNGWSASSYSYKWKLYDQFNSDLSITLRSGTGSGWTSTTGEDQLPASIWTSTNSTNADNQFLGFEVTANNSSNSQYNGLSVSTRIKVIREMPVNLTTALSTNSPTIGTNITYSSTWTSGEAYKDESARRSIQWYNNSSSSTTGGSTATGTGSNTATYTPNANDSGKYLYVIETRYNSGTDYDLGSSTGVSASVITASVVTQGAPSAPTSLTATSNRGDGVLLNWNAVPGANYYEIYWQSSQGTGPVNQSTFADFGQDNSITTNSFLDTTAIPGANRYYRVRSRSELVSTGTNCSNWFPAPASNAITGFRIKPGSITRPTAYSFSASAANGYFTTGTNTTSVRYKLQSLDIPISTPTYTQSTTSSYPYQVSLNVASLFTERTWTNDTWSPSTTYKIGNTVWYAGNQYQANRAVYRQVPPYDEIGFSGVAVSNTSYWTLITQRTYNVGDYVIYNGTRFYAKQTTTGVYPASGPNWNNGLGSWRYEFTPYYDTGAGDTVYSTATRSLVLFDFAAGDPMTLGSLISFTNVTGSSFTANYQTGSYANYVYIDAYRVSPFSRLSGYQKLKSVSTFTSYSEIPSASLLSSTSYGISITPRYYYTIEDLALGIPSIYYEGSGDVKTVTTLAPAPTAPTILSVTPGNVSGPVSVSFEGGSGPFYQAFWWGSSTAPTGITTPDATGSASPLTDNTGPGVSTNNYMFVRSTTVQDYTGVDSNIASPWSNGVLFNMTVPPVIPTITMAANSSITSSSGRINWTSTNQASFSVNGSFATSGTTATTAAASGLSPSTTYTGTVTVTSSTGHQASANYSLTTSAQPVAPTGGTATVNPTSGTAGSTTYTASTSGWTGTPTITYSYQWQRFTNNIFQYETLGTGTTFSPTAAQNSTALAWRLLVTASNGISPDGTASTSFTVNNPAVIPTITMAANSNITSSSGRINWTSTNQASFSVNGSFATSGTTATTAAASGLSPSTTYTGTVTVTSSTGNTASANYSLTTSAPAFVVPTCGPPQVSNNQLGFVRSGTSVTWYSDYPTPSGDFSYIIGMEWQIRISNSTTTTPLNTGTYASGGSGVGSQGTRTTYITYPGAGSYPYSAAGTIWAFRIKSTENTAATATPTTARFARARVIMMGTNGTVYFGDWSTNI
jgi:hypothetical protein